MFTQKNETTQRKQNNSAFAVADMSAQSDSLQRKADMAGGALQREAAEEDDVLQGKSIQREAMPEEEELAG